MRVKIVESLQNPTLKWIKKVCADPKKEGFVVFEGEHLLEEALKSGFYFQTLVMTEKKLERWKDELADYEVIAVNEEVFDKISLNKSPEGVMVIGKMEKHLLEVPDESSSYLYLDNVQDPVNVGILVRSAHAFSHDAVLVGKGSADPFNFTAIARSAGAIFHIPVFTMMVDEMLRWARFNGLSVFSAEAGGESLLEKTAATARPFVLVVGNEGSGVSEKIKEQSNKIISIPMRDSWNSLTVSAAGSILLYLLRKKEDL